MWGRIFFWVFIIVVILALPLMSRDRVKGPKRPVRLLTESPIVAVARWLAVIAAGCWLLWLYFAPAGHAFTRWGLDQHFYTFMALGVIVPLCTCFWALRELVR